MGLVEDFDFATEKFINLQNGNLRFHTAHTVMAGGVVCMSYFLKRIMFP
jgi:hypothetical protein